MMAAIVSGCHSHDHEHGHDHAAEEHGLEPLAYTMYTEHTELFVEFKPLVIGEESRFAAHFTRLGDVFLPYTEGTVNLTLTVDGKKTTITATEPEVPGIFRLRLTPEQVGKAKLVFDIAAHGVTDHVEIDGLQVFSSEEEAMNAPALETPEGEITYLKEQAWKVEFATQQIKRTAFYEVIPTSGKILSAPGDEVIVSATSGGIVLFGDVTPIEGSRVSSGADLFVVSGGGMAQNNIEAEFQEAKNNFEKAKADFERNSQLYEKEVISLKDFQEFKLSYDNAKNTFETISRNHSQSGQHMRTPIGGFIKHVFVTEGEFVEAGEPLAIVSKNEKLMLEVMVSQRYYASLPNVRSATFRMPMAETVYGTEDLNGRVVSYGRSSRDGSPFLPLNFELANRGQLVPGSMVEVYLWSKEIPEAMVIPKSALMEQQGKLYVFVQVSGESFDRREVTTGGDDGRNVQVLSGLKEGEWVVTKGAYQLKLASASGAIPEHGHEH